MTARQPTQLTTSTGAALPLPAMPQDKLLTVNIEQIPLIKDILGIPGIHIQPLRWTRSAESGSSWPLCPVLPADSLPHRDGAGVDDLGPLVLPRVPRPAADGGLLPVRAGRLSAHLLHPEDNTEDTITLAWIEGAQVSFNADGTFHSINDSVLIQHLTETVAAARGLGPVLYIRGNGADVSGS